MLIGILITFLVVILVLYLINMLPIDGRAKQIARVVVHHHRHRVAAEVSRGVLAIIRNDERQVGKRSSCPGFVPGIDVLERFRVIIGGWPE